MAEPIYKLFMMRPTQAAHELSKAEQDQVVADILRQALDCGIKPIFTVNSAWSSERWHYFGLQQAPDIDALRSHTDYEVSTGWFKYVDSRVMLGTALGEPNLQALVDAPERTLIKAVWMRFLPPWFQLSEEQRDEIFKAMDQKAAEFGAMTAITAETFWNGREWSHFTIDLYPSLDALQAYERALFDLGLYLYTESDSLLGMKMP